MTRIFGILLSVVLALGIGAPMAYAAGGGGSGNGGYSREAKSEAYLKAADLVEKDQFAEAIPLLNQAAEKNPKDADVHNLLGYSHRKLGAYQEALGHYQTALKLDPNHLGANEYLGELHLQMGDVAKAEERLSTLNWACIFGCDEYTELKQAIADYKAKNGG